MEPRRFGRYEIVREIGRGGMATVFLARDPALDRTVALKVLPREFTHDPSFLARFEREARTATLEHIAIVPIYDYGDHDGQPFIVMKLMLGSSLERRLLPGKLPIDETVRILTRIAEALDYAHSRGVIHRDLKPGNVLFDETDFAYLSDFGIARLTEQASNLTRGIVGTPAYMSPEQVNGDTAIDARSDQYALGVLAYEMLTGVRPYSATSPTRLMMAHVLEPVPDIRKANAELNAGVATVIGRVLAKSPADRYPDCAAFVSALKEALHAPAARRTTAPTLVDTAPGLSPFGEWLRDALRSTPMWVWGGVAALLVVSSLTAVAIASSLIANPGIIADGSGAETAQPAGALAAAATETPARVPTATTVPTATDTAVPTGTAPVCDHDARVIGAPESTDDIVAGTAFDVTWTLQNSGSCDWPSAFQAVVVEGQAHTVRDSITLTQVTGKGDVLQFLASVIAPETPGDYTIIWQMRDEDGNRFGDQARYAFAIPEPQPSTTGFDTSSCYPGDRWGRDVWAAHRDRLGCSDTTYTLSPLAVYQRFSSGMMVWEANRDKRVYVLFGNGAFGLYDVSAASSPYSSPNRSNLQGAIGYVWDTFPAARAVGEPQGTEQIVSQFDIQYFDGGVIFFFPEEGNFTVFYSGSWLRN